MRPAAPPGRVAHRQGRASRGEYTLSRPEPLLHAEPLRVCERCHCSGDLRVLMKKSHWMINNSYSSYFYPLKVTYIQLMSLNYTSIILRQRCFSL